MNILKATILMCLISCLNAQNQCKLPNRVNHNVAIGFPKVLSRLRSIGSVNVAVLFVDFNDRPAAQTTQQIFSIISPTTEQFYNSSSYGKLRLNLIPHLRWLRMSRSSASYNMNNGFSALTHGTYIYEAALMASLDNFDFSKMDTVVVMTNPLADSVTYGPAFCSDDRGIPIQGREFLNAASSGFDIQHWRNFWYIHELGHNLGLPDLYAYDTRNNPLNGYTGDWSLMGHINGRARELFGWERWLQGWLEDTQVVCINSRGTTNINVSPIARNDPQNTLKMIVIRLDETRAVVVESRRSMNYDSISKQGILVYLVDSSIRSGSGPLKVLPLNISDQNKLNNILLSGESINFENISINYLSNGANTDNVQVIYN